MTSPASASFPWPQAPEPPSGEFRSGRLPAEIGGDYLAARGSQPGPALLILVGPRSGYPAVHGVFRLAGVLDAHRLAGALLIRIAGSDRNTNLDGLLEPADALAAFDDLWQDWLHLTIARYLTTGVREVDDRAESMAGCSGTRYRVTGELEQSRSDPASWMARRNRPAVRLSVPGAIDKRSEAVEQVFQGMINMLRVVGMLEGQLSPSESVPLQQPAYAEAPVAGFWSPVARPGQRIRINDNLGSFRDARGNELGDLLTNVSGVLLGISNEVWVEQGQPVAELARPAG